VAERKCPLDARCEIKLADGFRGKKVLITGHTGFKGSWLTAWLLKMGAQVIGYSLDVPTQPSMFEALGLVGRINHVQGDVRDVVTMSSLVRRTRPDFVFHAAAQAIVSVSYSDPVETITTNVVGTMGVLEALRTYDRPCVAVLITSDKCYDNVEWVWGYRETDRLGGKDVYSGSKGAAELVINSYLHSFFQKDHLVRFGVGRAGNVIGGGDWARDRIVADCMRAWSSGQRVEIRSPMATRPWQHVLEPLSGYLWLALSLASQSTLHGEAFNFGPRAEHNHTVVDLIGELSRHWGFDAVSDACDVTGDRSFHEAGILKLNCDKALFRLRWEPTLPYADMSRLVSAWYKQYYNNSGDMYAMTLTQISEYEQIAEAAGKVWCKA
jgi:CDP-glucose 4,6-dehydratase